MSVVMRLTPFQTLHMGLQHVGHWEVAAFAADRVNLGREDAAAMREQAFRLSDRLEAYLADHPDFALRRITLSGSLAKGTALRSTSDVDLACYVASESAPAGLGDLIDWLATKLERAFPNIRPDQVKRKTYSVSLTFAGTGNEVDVVPIRYYGDPKWRGDLISQDTGESLMTSVPMHLEFIRRRKEKNKTHYAQVVRLLKYWAQLRKQENSDFRFKSFMLEMIVAHLADQGTRLDDYPEALASTFTFLAGDELRTSIVFSDYYTSGSCKPTRDAIRIWDPVNSDNNVAKLYTDTQRTLIADAAMSAGDALDAALRTTTKSETIRYWQKLLGPSFSA